MGWKRFIPSLLILIVSLSVVACGATGGNGKNNAHGDAGNGGSAGPKSDNPLDDLGGSSDAVHDLLTFLGMDRKPSRALKKIAGAMNLRTWTFRMDVEDAPEICRKAVLELTESDYASWDETGLVISVLSTMATRVPASLVRTECLGALEWFRTWVHPIAKEMGEGIPSDDEQLIRALRVLDDIHKDPKPITDPSTRLVIVDAIAILGSHPWDGFLSHDPTVIRTSLSRPRGVIRRLTKRDLTLSRQDPDIRRVLDQALVRVADQVIFLSQVSALADRTAYVRANAARLLGSGGNPRSVGPIAYALGEEQVEVALLAMLTAIEKIASAHPDIRKQAIPALAGALTATDASIRGAAARALSHVADADPGPDPSDWNRWWRKNRQEYEPR